MNGNQNCFNPLFIRSVFLLDHLRNIAVYEEKVSIPYSSGQCFFSREGRDKEIKMVKVSIPYSSGQCFFSSTFFYPSTFSEGNSFNPLFIRSVFLFHYELVGESIWEEFQSLIHQVSVSFIYFF